MLETRGSVRAPAARAWELLTDTARWPDWGPSVRAVDCAARLIGPGVHGRVQTTFGLWLRFEVTGWKAGEFWSWTVGGLQATGHRVIATGPDRCEVTFSVPRWAPFYLPVCAAAIRRIDRLAGRD